MGIRLILVDHHRLVRAALEGCHEQHHAARSARADSNRTVSAALPDLVLLDIAFPDLGTSRFSAESARYRGNVAMATQPASQENRYLYDVLRGGEAWTNKAADGVGGIWALVCPADDLRNAGNPAFAARRHDEPCLARREKEVLRLVAQGQRASAIAMHLGIAVGTVQAHRRNIMRKLGLHSVAELTRHAIREGIVSL